MSRKHLKPLRGKGAAPAKPAPAPRTINEAMAEALNRPATSREPFTTTGYIAPAGAPITLNPVPDTPPPCGTDLPKPWTPEFVLRAEDRLAPDTLRHYAERLAAAGGSSRDVGYAMNTAALMEQYQRDHGSKVGRG